MPENYIRKEEETRRLEGFRPYDFVGKDGQHVVGVSVYASTPIGSNGEGRAWEKASVSVDAWNRVKNELALGASISFLYNRYGKVRAIIPVKDEVDIDIDFGS